MPVNGCWEQTPNSENQPIEINAINHCEPDLRWCYIEVYGNPTIVGPLAPPYLVLFSCLSIIRRGSDITSISSDPQTLRQECTNGRIMRSVIVHIGVSSAYSRIMSAHMGCITPRQACRISPIRPAFPPKDDLRDVSDFFFQSLEFIHSVMDLQLDRADFLFTQCVFEHTYGDHSVCSRKCQINFSKEGNDNLGKN